VDERLSRYASHFGRTNTALTSTCTAESGGMIALTANEAAELHLERSVEDPDDPAKQIYFMAGYHHIHCLVSHSRGTAML
jgi:hypothetical protein